MKPFLTDEAIVAKLAELENRFRQLKDALVDIGYRLPTLAREASALADEAHALRLILEPSTTDRELASTQR